MKKIDKLLAIKLALTTNSSYDNYLYCEDEKVNDCIMMLYLYIISNEEKYLTYFENEYSSLNEEQREKVKNDYSSLLEEKRSNKTMS